MSDIQSILVEIEKIRTSFFENKCPPEYRHVSDLHLVLIMVEKLAVKVAELERSKVAL